MDFGDRNGQWRQKWTFDIGDKWTIDIGNRNVPIQCTLETEMNN